VSKGKFLLFILCRIQANRLFKSGIIGAVDKIHHFLHKNRKNHHPDLRGDGYVTVGEFWTGLTGKDDLFLVSPSPGPGCLTSVLPIPKIHVGVRRREFPISGQKQGFFSFSSSIVRSGLISPIQKHPLANILGIILYRNLAKRR